MPCDGTRVYTGVRDDRDTLGSTGMPRFPRHKRTGEEQMQAGSATLYRHFVVGLDDGEIMLLSRLKATTFEDATAGH